MIKLTPFTSADFDRLISWIDSKELLITIAGPFLTYPLTTDQLEKYLANENSISFNIVDASDNKVIGHAEIDTSNGGCKIDKLLIGDPAQRGKGIGEQVMNELIKYSFNELDVDEVELNVYEWNKAGIRCYEKVGFVINPEKKMVMPVGNVEWVAVNMHLSRDGWEEN